MSLDKPHNSKKIYLDYAAATSLDPNVLAAMEPYFTDRFYNPSALYLDAKAVSRDIAGARSRIAGWMGARPGEVIFTAGGTEANNLAIHGVMQSYPESKMLASSIEHESVLNPARRYNCREIPVDTLGIVRLSELESLIDDNTVLISVMYANNEIGTIQPLKDISQLITKVRKSRRLKGNDLPLYLHSDAAQASNYLDLQVSRLGVDLMTINAGKIYGPKQCGALYVRAGTVLQPQILGGGQELGLRSGTENPAGIIGFAAALDLVQQDRQQETKRLQALQKLFLDLITRNLPDAVINGSQKHRLPNNVHITLPTWDNERLIMSLDENGILAAAGSACSASSEEPSHVLSAIGLTNEDILSSLRFTMGRFTTDSEVKRTVDVLTKLVA